MAVGHLFLAAAYASSSDMARAFVRANGYALVLIDREPGSRWPWRVWLGRYEDGSFVGTYDAFATKRLASRAAETASRVFRLPIRAGGVS